jgi:PAS domain S-box-containing protein
VSEQAEVEFGPGGPVRVVGTVLDVTDRVRAGEALRASEERLRTLSDNLPDGAVYQTVATPDGGRRFAFISAGVERVFGVTAAEATADATALYGLVHEDDRERLAAAEAVALRDGGPFDCEFRSRTRSGEVRWVHCRSAPRRLPTGETVWEGIVMDVTARKRAEADRERLVGQLRDADRRKDEFLATLAHELRNPLAPLRNGLQILRLARGDAAAVDRSLGMMDRQLGQMVHLIDDLLDVSRITRGKLHLRRERIDLAAVVQNAVEASRPLVEAAAHRLTVALPSAPVYLDADPTRLAQVLANLLTNAAKYTERGGDIRLTAERRTGDVVVSVRDTGIGISPEHLPRLFEMFSQVDSALERSQGGLGIGLALVKGLVEMHGGTVEARSEGRGRGSEFVVRLPLPAETTAGPAHAANGDVGAAARPRRRILVADDNRDAADSLAEMLRLFGHEVHAAHDGREAVEAAGWFRPEGALLDIGMPRLNGYEAARLIRDQAWGESITLVAVTGWGQEDDRRRAAEAGFDVHLTKPVAPADLDRLLADLTPRG